MPRPLALALAVLAPMVIANPAAAQAKPTPRPAAAPNAVRARVDALLARMTLEEKVGQMTQLTVGAVATSGAQPAGAIALDPARLREAIVTRHVGSILNMVDGALPLDAWHAVIRQIQDVATRETRLHIPVLYGIDAVHGDNYTVGGTIFPHNVAMAATFDVAMARRAGEITGDEVLASAQPWNFAPVLDVGRQPLFPRFYETFGEDPLVAARMGGANVAGIQRSGRVAATMKHYLAYSAPRSGKDRTPTELSERDVREIFLPPFRAAVQAGAMSVMVNSGEIDGEPVHASHHWLTDVLRGELGFQGVIVTDWEDINFLHTRHRVAPTLKDAVRMAVMAGVDMSMTPLDYRFADDLIALVKEGAVPVSRVDESVRRILTMKANLGVLDSPYPDAGLRPTFGAAASRAVARAAAEASVTLLKNDGATLPLEARARVLVTGPAARSVTALNGGWTWTWQGTDLARYPKDEPTLYDAIREHAPAAQYVDGGGFTGAGDDAASQAKIAAAVAAAKNADVAVVVLGEAPYAEWVGDIEDLTLPAAQLRLAAAVQATGTPTVLVLLEGRPRIVRDVVPNAKAVVMGYWPGMEGAGAIARVLFGDVNPSGRLPFTYPKHPNALVRYDHKQTETLGAGFDRAPTGFDPQWEFGHGLSYTTFSYGGLAVSAPVARAAGAGVRLAEPVTVSVTVTNTGARAGRESVLLFTRQHYAAITPSVRRLRGFEPVELAPGASRTLTFTLTGDDLSYIGRDNRPVLEAGDFDVMVGGQKATFRVAAPAAQRTSSR